MLEIEVNPIDARSVANWFIKRSLESGIEITTLRVMKLVYIAHGYSLGLIGKPLISEVTFTDKYGPIEIYLQSHIKTINLNFIATKYIL